MRINILFVVLMSFCLLNCGHDMHEHENTDDHDVEHTQNTDQHEEPGHTEHEEKAEYLTSYSKDFELFVETEPLVMGKESHMLAHLTVLPAFKALQSGKLTMMIVKDNKVLQKMTNKPVQHGLCHLNITPQSSGTLALRFTIEYNQSIHEILVPDVVIFEDEHEAHETHEEEENEEEGHNLTVFTKEQSWKTSFATAYPKKEAFGDRISCVGRIEEAPGEEHIITAKTKGAILLTGNTLLPGREVRQGQRLLTISGNKFAENNMSVKYTEAKNDFEYAKSEYERAQKLSQEKIISEKELLRIKKDYENAKSHFQVFKDNFYRSGQHITSPINGFVKQVYVKNGAYIEEGQIIAVVSHNKKVLIKADVPQKHAAKLHSISSATLKNLWDKNIYTLEELHGSVLSFGKAVNNSNYLLPVILQIKNSANFIQGSFVDVCLKIQSADSVPTIPNTALLEEQGIYYVYVQKTPELFDKREVVVGASDGLRSAVIDGLNENERIVTKGAVMLKLSQATGALDAHSGHVH